MITENRYEPVRNFFRSRGIRFRNISPTLKVVVVPVHSTFSKTKPLAGLTRTTTSEDNKKVAINISANRTTAFMIRRFFSLRESKTETLILVKTTGTIMYFRKVMYQAPINAIASTYVEKNNPKIIPKIKAIKVNKDKFFFMIRSVT